MHIAKLARDNAREDWAYRLRPLQLLMQQFPRDGKWSAQRREKWLNAFEKTVDMIIDVEP